MRTYDEHSVSAPARYCIAALTTCALRSRYHAAQLPQAHLSTTRHVEQVRRY